MQYLSLLCVFYPVESLSKRYITNVELMLTQCPQRWPNINPTSDKHRLLQGS